MRDGYRDEYQVLEDVEVLKYIRPLLKALGRLEAEIERKVFERSLVMGVVRSFLEKYTMSWR